MDLGKDESDDAREPSVLDRGAQEAEEDEYNEDQHETAGDMLRIGASLICRFSYIGHILFRLFYSHFILSICEKIRIDKRVPDR